MLAKLGKILLYTVAALIVLLAVAVGVLRIAMPQLPEYRDEIIARIAEAIDGDVYFDRLDARWRLRGPEIVFHDVVIGERVGSRTIAPLRVETVTVGVSVSRLLFSQQLEVRRIGIEGASILVARHPQGWQVQGAFIQEADADAPTAPAATLPFGDALGITLDDVIVRYQDAVHEREVVAFDIEDAQLRLSAAQIRLSAALSHIVDGGAEVDLLVAGNLPSRSVAGAIAGDWTVSADIEAVSAELVASLLPPDWPLPQSGSADLVADIDWRDGDLEAAVLTLDADDLSPPDGGDAARVSGRAEWSRRDDGWLWAVSNFVVGVSDRQWPAASALVNLARTDETMLISFDSANVTVYDMPYLASFLPAELAPQVIALGLNGTLVSGSGFVQMGATSGENALTFADLEDYELSADFEEFSLAPVAGAPGFTNLSGSMRVTKESGRLELDSSNASLVYPTVFESPVALTRLSGTLIWRSNVRGVSLLSDSILVQTPVVTMDSSLELLLPKDGSSPVIDVESVWAVTDISQVEDVLPTAVMSPKLVDWLDNALETGEVVDGEFQLSGALADFPFRNGEGVFRARGLARNVTMRFARQWPAISELDAIVELDGLSLSTDTNTGVSGGIAFENAVARFDELGRSDLIVETAGKSGASALYRYVGNSPIRGLFGDQFVSLQVDGDIDYDVSLGIPLRAIPEFTLDARLTALGGSFGLSYLPHQLTDLRGDIRIDRSGVYGEQVQADFLGEPVTLGIQPTPEDERYSLRVSANGSLTATALLDELNVPLPDRVAGQAAFDANVRLPRRASALSSPAPVLVGIETTLEGLSIDLPYPAGKPADAALPLRGELSIDGSISAAAKLGELLDIAALIDRDAGQDRFEIDRVTIHLGTGRALLSTVPGIFIDGRIDQLYLGDWLDLRLGEGGWFTANLKSASVQADAVMAFGQLIRDVTASLQQSGDNWLVDLQSPAVEGAVSVPRNLGGDAPIVLDMSRLRLLEADPDTTGQADPSAIPALRVRATEFALGDRQFGALEADIDRLPDGIVISRIATAADAFAVTGNGQWVLDPVEEEGSRTSMQASVRSTDVKRMMSSLGYAPGINAESLTSTLDVSWAGGPDEDFVASLDGTVSVSIGNGTLDEVEPGAGRVVGLISIAELPRRLSLDFRDVFQKGFSFDEINGDFRLVNGDAYTCNLSLKGSSADVGIIGRASLDRRNYNQTAVVSVKVGNTLPAVGAVVAGPQVGAALLLFSQIFKKPLRGMTEVYYQINGGWDEPSIDRTDAARFVATSELAGCLVDNIG
ncbi:MAG: YhdP family protein [Pseudomonadota bacterium]